MPIPFTRAPLATLCCLLAACQFNSSTPAASKPVIPYGEWPTPVSAASTVAGGRGLVNLDADGGYLYWAESRPEEKGRTTLMRWRPGGEPEEILPAEFNARTRVQEYGGRSFLAAGGTVWFSNFDDQRLYRMVPGEAPVAITPEADLRYGACVYDGPRSRLVCIREDHRGEGEAANTLVGVPLSGVHEGEVLFGDADFVSAASLSPDGRSIAFVSWDHPNLPWDATTLWVGRFDAQGNFKAQAQNPGRAESVMDPQWDAQNTLYAISDRSNWWSLYRVEGEQFTALPTGLETVEIGEPAWTIGNRYYQLLGDGRIAALVVIDGSQQVQLIDPAKASSQPLDLDTAYVGDMLAAGETLYLIQGRQTAPTELLSVSLADGQTEQIRKASDTSISPEWVPRAVPVSYPTASGATAYGIYYPPTNPDVQAPGGTAPPLLIEVHGGPTSSTVPSFSMSNVYWTSRGFAILDINYRGSSGYGTNYRRALYGEWGVVDVEDAVYGARWAAAQGLADPQRLIIRGGSAGGFTTLAAHAFYDTFSAGASYFGVSDMEALALETHKFESRYLDQLVGPYPAQKQVYAERSPINHLEGFQAPLILLQGLDDKVVPPNQSERIYAALKARGVPTAYLAFEGEGHGFRRAENRIRALEAELYFYGKVLGFEPAGELPAIDIDGL